jgi:hypothetical protein
LVDACALHSASILETSAGIRTSIVLVLILTGFGTLLQVFKLL